MKKTIFKILAFSLSLACVLSCSGCIFGGSMGHIYDSDYGDSYDDMQQSPALGSFTIDTTRIAVNSTSYVCMYVYADFAPASIGLYDDTSYIGEMYDDGVGDDLVAGDGIYSTSLSITTTEADANKTFSFHAQYDASISNTATIEILPLPNENQAAEAYSISMEFNNIINNNMSDPAAQLSSAAAYAEELFDQGVLADYTISEYGVDMLHSSGVRCVFNPYIEGTLAVGDGSSATIVTFDPFSDAPEFTGSVSAFSDGVNLIYASEQTYLAANNISGAFSNYSYPAAYDLDTYEVTTDSLSACMDPNQVIIWNGHGGFTSEEGPILCTSSIYDANRASTDAEYYNKFVTGEYVLTIDGEICVSGKFISNNIGDLSGSLVYLNACLSGTNSMLADAFLKKGAICVATYSDSVYVPYAAAMQYTIFTQMTAVNSSTGEYNTMQDAIDIAKYNYGSTDYDKHPPQPPKDAAYLIVYGADPATVRLASTANMPASDSSPAVLPTAPPQQPTVPPTQPSNADAHSAYKAMLQENSWIQYCPSDLSEIPPAEYDNYWLGVYYVCDIDDNGIDELIIKAGQSISDTSMTVFTYTSSGIVKLGHIFAGDARLMDIKNSTGVIVCERHGGEENDTYLDIVNGSLTTIKTESANYEQPGYVDEKANIADDLTTYNVHDLSGL